jgi:uncharacterized RDD family membrane protein YckC
LSARIDTLIRAETPEGISLAIRPAGIAVRGTAFVIDVAIRYVSLSVILGIISAAGRFAIGPALIVLFLLNWLYPVFFELTAGAATPGKRAMGLQVMMASGLPLTPAGSLIRNLMRFVDLLPFMYAIGLVSILLRYDARRLGDLAGGTVVVYKPEPPLARTIQNVAPFAPREALSARQRAAITSFAWRVEGLTAERAEEIAVLAKPVIAPELATQPMTSRLIGIARWLHGQRRTVGGPPA